MINMLSIVDESHESCYDSFRKIANALMNDHKLQVKNHYYRITECEFYFNSENHSGPYVHSHERQKNSCGEWYFHGSGLDITFGDGKCFGGILLRGIAKVSTTGRIPIRSEAISGPLNVCQELFSKMGSAFSAAPIDFGIVDISRDPMGANMKTARIFAVPRIGLNADKPSGSGYWDKPYRFLSFLHLPHKDKEKVQRYLVESGREPITQEEYKLYSNASKW